MTLMSGEQKFLQQLKEMVDPKDWPKERAELAAKVPQVYRARIVKLLLAEKAYTDLFDFLMKQEMEFGMSLAKAIDEVDPIGFIEWVERAMLAELARQRASHFYHVYQRALHFIRERKGSEYAAKLLQTIIAAYPTARGLHEALRR